MFVSATSEECRIHGTNRAVWNSIYAEPYRRELLVYGYRLLGSIQDAEDLIQETLLRAWTNLATFAGRSSFRAWLYKIATNAGLNMLANASRRSVPVHMPSASSADSSSLPQSADLSWLEPLPDACIIDMSPTPDAVYSLRESVSLAFTVALHSLPPHQRATLILRDVLDWHATEVAAFLDMSVQAANSALQRARATLAKHYHPIDVEAIEAPTLTPTLKTLLDRYMHAWETNNVDELVAVLKEDATFSMPPEPAWYLGRNAIRQFFQSHVFTIQGSLEWQLASTWANAQPAYVLYRRNPATEAFGYFGVLILTLSGNSIASATAFIDTALENYFGVL